MKDNHTKKKDDSACGKDLPDSAKIHISSFAESEDRPVNSVQTGAAKSELQKKSKDASTRPRQKGDQDGALLTTYPANPFDKLTASSVNGPELAEGHPEQATNEVRSASKESTGAILKKAREAQGISLEIVHETTKIPLDALRAIEEGYTIRILSPFYYRGFVKMYADFLGLNASELLDDYTVEKLPQHISRDVDESAVVEWFNKTFTKKRKQKIVIGIGIAVVVFLFFKFIGFLTHRKSISPASTAAVKTKVVKVQSIKKEVLSKEAQKVPEKMLEKASEKLHREEVKVKLLQEDVKSFQEEVSVPALKAAVPEEPKAVEQPGSKPMEVVGVPPAVTVNKNITLTVRANQNTWLRVKADENVVFQSILRAGAVETWLADKEVEISGRNINELEFELNGKMIGALGRKDRDAKKVVVTKNGLSVKQE